MADSLNAYKILQVDAEAEDEVVQAAYRRLARKYHPDLAGGEVAAARMAAINAAWELIGEPFARAAYDRNRAAGTPASPPVPKPAPPSTTTPTAASPSGRQPNAGRSHEDGRPGSAGHPGGSSASPQPHRSPDTVSRDWTSGRSSHGGGYDASMRAADGPGAAGPPPGRPAGSVLNFGRYSGWSLGEIAGRDLEYIEWLDRVPIGRIYRDEIDAILRATGRRRSAGTESTDRRGLFRRR